jgi:tRNA-intron endonuclease
LHDNPPPNQQRSQNKRPKSLHPRKNPTLRKKTRRQSAELQANLKPITIDEADKKFSKIDKKFPIKYAVYKDLRDKGHVPKTALKFGAEFRVYKKGKGPGKGHSDWIVFTESEKNSHTWHDFTAKNRVAHSTNKKLLMAIVDDEKDVSYFEISWTKI